MHPAHDGAHDAAHDGLIYPPDYLRLSLQLRNKLQPPCLLSFRRRLLCLSDDDASLNGGGSSLIGDSISINQLQSLLVLSIEHGCCMFQMMRPVYTAVAATSVLTASAETSCNLHVLLSQTWFLYVPDDDAASLDGGGSSLSGDSISGDSIDEAGETSSDDESHGDVPLLESASQSDDEQLLSDTSQSGSLSIDDGSSDEEGNLEEDHSSGSESDASGPKLDPPNAAGVGSHHAMRNQKGSTSLSAPAATGTTGTSEGTLSATLGGKDMDARGCDAAL